MFRPYKYESGQSGLTRVLFVFVRYRPSYNDSRPGYTFPFSSVTWLKNILSLIFRSNKFIEKRTEIAGHVMCSITWPYIRTTRRECGCIIQTTVLNKFNWKYSYVGKTIHLTIHCLFTPSPILLNFSLTKFWQAHKHTQSVSPEYHVHVSWVLSNNKKFTKNIYKYFFNPLFLNLTPRIARPRFDQKVYILINFSLTKLWQAHKHTQSVSPEHYVHVSWVPSNNKKFTQKHIQRYF